MRLDSTQLFSLLKEQGKDLPKEGFSHRENKHPKQNQACQQVVVLL